MRNLLVTVLYSWLAVDTLNGIFVAVGASDKFAVLIRGIELGFLFIYLAWRSVRHLVVPATLLAVLVLLTILQISFLGGNLLEMVRGLAKITLPIALVSAVLAGALRGDIVPTDLRRIVAVNALVLLANLALGYLGIGYGAYRSHGHAIGGTGYLIAGNEAGVVVLVAALFWLAYAFSERKPILALVISAIGAFAASAVLSKTALFGVGLLIAAYLYRSRNRVFLIPLGLLAGLALWFQGALANQLALAMARWHYFAQTYGFWTYFLGGIKRQDALREIAANWIAHPFSFVLGVGWQGVAENNLVDLAQAYGLFGLVIVAIWGYWLIFLARMGRSTAEEVRRYVSMAWPGYLLVLFVASFAGHVVQSAMLAVFVASVVGYPVVIERNQASGDSA